MAESDAKPEVCCLMRKKIALTPYSLPQELCGVSDAEIADFLVFDVKSPNGRPVLTFRFCPWCGKPWKTTGMIQEAAPQSPEEDEGEDWKQGESPEE
jgi:hypothetical protein